MENLEILYQQQQAIQQQKKQVVLMQNFDQAAQLRQQEIIIQQQIDNIIMKNNYQLSKRRYLRGEKCSKNLWLYIHKVIETEVSEAQEAIFQTGHNVGALAQNYFANGVLAVQPNGYPNATTAAYTAELISKGTTTIYEATFIYDNIVVAVDVLHKIGNTWHLFEVKSTTKVKDTHITDCAIQYYVLKNSLLQQKFQNNCSLETNVMFLNNQYVRQSELDVQQLFAYENVTEIILEMQAAIAPNTRDMRIMLNASMPNIAMGEQCHKPYDCEYINYCSAALNLQDDEVVEENLSTTPIINHQAIADFIAAVKYPLGFLDFETIMPAVPLWNNSRPYQQIVFQYSLHIQTNNKPRVIHLEHLAQHDADPRISIIQQMLKVTESLNTIFVYNIGFERSRLKEMMRDFPEYENELLQLIEKLVDLMPIFRYHYRTESMGKKYSIKIVLPTFIPHLSYDDLEIGNGTDASNAYFNLYNCNDANLINTTRQHLIEYCKLDTLAMVALWSKISE